MASAILKLRSYLRLPGLPLRFRTVLQAFEAFKMNGSARYHEREETPWQEHARAAKRRLDADFPKRRRRKNEFLDRASLVARYHAIYLAGKFPFGIPDNFLTGPKVVQILARRAARLSDPFYGSING